MTRARHAFTLVEVVVVLVLLALMAAVAAPAFSAAVRRRAVDDATGAVTRVLAHARAQALVRGTAVSLVIDPAQARVWQQHPDTSFVLSLPDECTLRADAPRATFTFRPDGSAAGDVLGVQCGAHAASISADPLTGAITVLGGQ